MDERTFQISSRVKASVSADGLVLLDVHGGVVLASNPAGARIWQLLEERQSVPEIAGRFVDDYHIAAEQAHRDVQAFVDALLARRLVAEVRS